MNYHVPVLLNESISGLSIEPTGTYIDLTFGGGGHTKYILKFLEKKGKLFSFDTDTDSFQIILNLLIVISDILTFILSRGVLKRLMEFLQI